MRADISETGFKKHVYDDLDTLEECYYFKTQERTRKGVHDIVMCLKGRFVSIELKKETGTVSALQTVNIGRVLKARGIAFATSPSQWDKHFEMLRGIK